MVTRPFFDRGVGTVARHSRTTSSARIRCMTRSQDEAVRQRCHGDRFHILGCHEIAHFEGGARARKFEQCQCAARTGAHLHLRTRASGPYDIDHIGCQTLCYIDLFDGCLQPEQRGAVHDWR